MGSIYMDHAATTPVHKQVIEAMIPIYEEVFGNPSSVHSFGRQARHYLDEARHVIAQSIQASDREIIFTSGGTEADNLALIGTAIANRDRGNHIITTVQEHHAALHTAHYLETIGFSITYLPIYEHGRIEVSDLEKALTEETILVSVLSVNNETGLIQPIQEIGELLASHQAHFHTDAVQGFELLPFDVNDLGIDLLTASSHKINGPKGIGFLYVADHVKINPLQFGGEQERKRRPGTENVAAVVGFQRAVELVIELQAERQEAYKSYKEHFLKTLAASGVEFTVNGDAAYAVPSIVSVSFPGTDVEKTLTNLDLDGIAASSGSACTAGSIEPSHVLQAMYGDHREETTNSIRFSFGLGHSEAIVEEAAERVAKVIQRLTTNRRT